MTTDSPLSTFSQHLFLDGQALVGNWLPPTSFDINAAQEFIHRAHQIAAAEAPSQSPTLDLASATWATRAMYWAACMFVDRAATETQLPPSLLASEPNSTNACHQWSVDLALRFLPSLIQRSQRIASDDRLSQTLLDLASRWPLSSVGVRHQTTNVLAEPSEFVVDDSKLAVIATDPCLRGILIDRVLKQKCIRLANHVLFHDAVKRAIGPYDHLARWLVTESELMKKE